MMGSSKNPLFLGNSFVLGDLSVVDQTGNRVGFGDLWAEFEIMPKNRDNLRIFGVYLKLEDV